MNLLGLLQLESVGPEANIAIMQLTHNNFRSHSPNNNITRQELPLKANLTEENEITTGYLLRYKYNGIKPDNKQTDENNTRSIAKQFQVLVVPLNLSITVNTAHDILLPGFPSKFNLLTYSIDGFPTVISVMF